MGTVLSVAGPQGSALSAEGCSSFRDDTHKVDVINFAQSKATQCLQNESLIDKESANLLWNFIILLCRQNGVRAFLPLKRHFLAWSLRDPGALRCGEDFCAGSSTWTRLSSDWGRGDKQGVRWGRGEAQAHHVGLSAVWSVRLLGVGRGGGALGGLPQQGLWEVLSVVKALVLSVPAALQTVVGTDIAELLLQDHRTVWLPGKSPNEANLIDFTNEAVGQTEEEESVEAQLSFLTDSQAATSSLEKETERFRELLLYGRKKASSELSGAGPCPGVHLVGLSARKQWEGQACPKSTRPEGSPWTGVWPLPSPHVLPALKTRSFPPLHTAARSRTRAVPARAVLSGEHVHETDIQPVVRGALGL